MRVIVYNSFTVILGLELYSAPYLLLHAPMKRGTVLLRILLHSRAPGLFSPPRRGIEMDSSSLRDLHVALVRLELFEYTRIA